MQKELIFLNGRETQWAYSSGGETPRGQKGTPGGTAVPGITGSIPHSLGGLCTDSGGVGAEELNGTGTAGANGGTIECAPGKVEVANAGGILLAAILFAAIGIYIIADGGEEE